MSQYVFKMIPVCLFAYLAAIGLLNPTLADNNDNNDGWQIRNHHLRVFQSAKLWF